MAGERIAIYETESKIIEGDYGDFYNTISRAEAIERMAKAMYEFSTDEFRGEKFPYEFEEMAEAALDALVDK